ncbi:hypothetical protein [Luteibacter sp. Lutesp34]|uniref:hypothetical protein n=1 Tax=Luteibacter sp. Lutesp34 TaxID=3243030 RepID=UPI0039B4CAEE
MLALAALWPGVVLSNQQHEMTLSEKVESSDLVLMASIVAVGDGECLAMHRCARLNVATMLKGKAPVDMAVLFDGPIAEENPLCCEVGQTYLLFLKRTKGAYFQSTNGPFGIYRVK